MTAKDEDRPPHVNHAVDGSGRRRGVTCSVTVDDLGDLAVSLEGLAALARRAGFDPAAAMLSMRHEQARPYVEDDWACSDGCEYGVHLDFSSDSCSVCIERIRLAVERKARSAERRKAKTERQRASA